MVESMVLFSWIGINDILNTYKNKKLSGAIAQVLEARNFYKINLINGIDYSKYHNEAKYFIEKLTSQMGKSLFIKRVENFNPINYGEICAHLIPFLKEQYSRREDTYFLQTSGTPSTAVVWILLAQTNFPAKLLQASKERNVEEINLPFNVYADFIPKNLDKALSDLIGKEGVNKVIYDGNPIERILRKTDQAALHDVPILLLGESGTGKELFAERIHQVSGRKGEIIKVNCGAIPPTLAESELFGAVKGAYTGAAKDTKGKFEAADKGTLFLDEIGEMPIDLQVKILRVLQEKTIQKIGSTEEKKLTFGLLQQHTKI